MDNKKPKQFLVNPKSFRDEEKPQQDAIQFHQQSPRFKNSKIQQQSQQNTQSSNLYKDEVQMSPLASPKGQKTQIFSQNVHGSGGKFYNSKGVKGEQDEYILFEYKGEKDFFNKLYQKLNETSSMGEVQITKLFEKVYKCVLDEDFSLSSLQKTITRSNNNNWKDLLKIKSFASGQALIANILPHFSKALQRRSLSNIQDLLKITLLYQYEYYVGMEKQLNQIIDLFTKMLQIPQKSEEEDTISNHVQRLVLLNIQSFCIPQISSKFQTEFQLIFKRIQELIMHFFNLINNQNSPSIQQQPSSSTSNVTTSLDSSSKSNYYSFLRFLATLLRTGYIVLLELKENKTFLLDANNQKLTEKVFLRIFKYIFLGNPTFHQVIFGQNQNRIFSSKISSSSQLTDFSNGSRNNLSTNSNSLMNNSFSASSQSEWSENDEHLGYNDKTRIEIIEGKVRIQTCNLLSTIIRLFPAIVKNQWQILIKSNNMTKDFIHSLKNHGSLEEKIHFNKEENEKKIIKEEEEDNKKDDNLKNSKFIESNSNIRDYSLLYPNYMEVSLLSCLVFEESNKVKSNALQIIQSLIENLPSKQLISGLEIQKFEKSTSSFKPQSYLIYQSYKNIHFTLIHLLQTLCSKHVQQYDQTNNQILNQNTDSTNTSPKDQQEKPQAEDLFVNDSDEEVLSLCNQILKVYISLFNSTVQFEKMPFKEGIDLILRQFIFKVLRHIKTQEASLEALPLKYNALQILNCVAKCNIRFDLFANRYLQNNNESSLNVRQKNASLFNLFDLCVEDILLKNIHSAQNGEVSQCIHDISLLQKEDALRELISLESISLLTNLQMNYFDCTLLYSSISSQKSLFPLWEKISEKIKTFEDYRNKHATDKKRLFLLYELVIMIAEKNNSAVQIAKPFLNSSFSQKSQDQIQQDNNEEETIENVQDEEENQEIKSQTDKNLTQFFEQNQELVKKSEQFDNVFSVYLISKVKQLIQQSIEQEQNKTKDEIEMPLMITLLNMSVHIRNDQWLQNQDFYNFFKNQIFSINIVQSIRFYILKTLGSLISCSIFNSDQSNCKQILDILLREKQLIGQRKTSANLSVYSKLSQSLANWCYYVKDFSIISQQSLSKLFVALQDISSSPKDKVSPHGLRALGIFLMKMNRILYLSICDPSKEDQTICKLITENLTHKSSKVVWNACVAIQNIFSNIDCILTETNKANKLHYFFSSKSISNLVQSLEAVLQSINNQKSQFYALKALKNVINHPISLPQQKNNLHSEQDIKILNERIPHLLNVLTEIGSNMYSFHQAHNTNKSLGELVVQFLIQMITRVHSLIYSNEILVEFIKDKYYQIISSFSQYIYQLWKNNKLDLHLAVLKEESYQDSEQQIFNYKSKAFQNAQQGVVKTDVEDQNSENKMDQQSKQTQQDNFEELLIKGQDEFKSVQFDFNQIKRVKVLKEQLSQLKEASIILQKVIDQNDDLSVSLTIYDHIKEYASVNLEQDIINFSIH